MSEWIADLPSTQDVLDASWADPEMPRILDDGEGWPGGRSAWKSDCLQWRGRVLTGRLRHWCFDWDALPVDETCLEITCCTCWRWDVPL